MKKGILLAMALTMTTMAFAQNSERKVIQLTAEERALVNGNNQFAFNLFKKARGNEDMLLSPLSITYALGMLNNGAAGETQAEINQVLGFGDAGADAINAFCRKMLTESPALDEQTKVMIANAIYVNEGLGYRLQDDFVQKATSYYDAEVDSRDFSDGQTTGVINQWAADHTNQLIEKMISGIDAAAISILLNAIYFKGVWAQKFDKDSTREEQFGSGNTVNMMHMRSELRCKDFEDFQVLVLPYGNDSYRMTILLPHEGKQIDDILNDLSGESWQKGFGYMPMCEADVKLPRMDIETEADLNSLMMALGMSQAFSAAAEFPYFCNAPCHIGNMKQKAKMHLDEEGTEAAAATSIIMIECEPESVVFHATRPFVYIISEQSTGSIFFIGQFTGVKQQKEQAQGVDSPVRTPLANGNVYNLNGQRIALPQHGQLYIRDGKKFIQP